MNKHKYVFPLSFCFVLILYACIKQPINESLELTLREVNTRISVGSPIDISYTNDKYMGIIKTEINAGQSLWYPHAGGWLSAKTYNFSGLNANINWMRERGMTTNVHMLVGPDYYMPSWLLKGNWQKSELDSLLLNMINSIMDANDNKTKVNIWNVANELFEDDGTYRTEMIWNQLGWETDASTLTGADKINSRHPLFIRKAFTYCRAKTSQKLEFRDDWHYENVSPTLSETRRQKAVFQLLKHMRNSNIPVDAFGIQGHISIGKTDWANSNKALKNAVAKFKSLGIAVYITELDASIENRTWTTDLAQKQKDDYYNYAKQAIEGGASSIHFWGIHDGFDKTWLATQHPLIWDENIDKKPAYYGLKQALLDTK
jgi:GH35 family endo-1,4-beta-xylanase